MSEVESGDWGTLDLLALADAPLNPTVDFLVVNDFLERVLAATGDVRAALVEEAEKAISPDPDAHELFRFLLADAVK
jgi:hypothetical protein